MIQSVQFFYVKLLADKEINKQLNSRMALSGVHASARAAGVKLLLLHKHIIPRGVSFGSLSLKVM